MLHTFLFRILRACPVRLAITSRFKTQAAAKSQDRCVRCLDPHQKNSLRRVRNEVRCCVAVSVVALILTPDLIVIEASYLSAKTQTIQTNIQANMADSTDPVKPATNDGVYYAEGQAVTATGTPGQKEGHLYMGCCCDTRRATIIVNIVNLVLAVITALIYGLASGIAVNELDDDAIKNDIANKSGAIAGIIALFFVIALTFSGLGIYGAMKYNKCMVISAAVWYGLSALVSLSGGDVLGCVISGLFCYPHVMFVQEMQKGIMTEQNYPNEMHSCCCV